MNIITPISVVSTLLASALVWRVRKRLLLSKAKHPSLRGHVRMGKRVARLIPRYEFDEARFFDSDGAPEEVASRRKAGFQRLATGFAQRNPTSTQLLRELAEGVSDLQFVGRYRVPFQYSALVRERLKASVCLQRSAGVELFDLDDNAFYDLTGSYGVNVFGYDFYKACIDAGADLVRELGPVLGLYHPVLADNVKRLREISGLDEVSFHMSGTEAVMQAVRLARYHTERSHVVRFVGAYHGWWDEVQPGIGNPGRVGDIYTLKDMSADTLRVLRSYDNIACVLVNPIQGLHPNGNAPGDGSLVASDRSAAFDREAYSTWLRELQQVCNERGIVFILDEVFVGFRLAYGGAQEYFGVQADLVTYGKTLGGGLPVGVVCGRSHLMKRFREDRPADICFARGTFNSHPYVMAAMNEFLRRLGDTELRQVYEGLDERWNARAKLFNEFLQAAGLPLQVANLQSIFTVLYTQPSRYNWMLQYYLNAEGLMLSWVGTGRLIFSLNYSHKDFLAVVQRFVRAAQAMQAEGWWWQSAELTNQTIKRSILKEMLRSRLRGRETATSLK